MTGGRAVAMQVESSIGKAGSSPWSMPAVQVLLFVLVQGLLWTVIPGLLHRSPPVDTIEVYMWAREGLLVSNKHPNMAGWLLAISQAVTGAYGWSAYLLAQVCGGVSIMFVYLLGREMTTQRSAMLGAVLLCTLGHFTWFTPQYNSNIASMPFWAGFAWALWLARRDGTLLRWILVGIFGAGVVACKVSGGILLLIAAAYALVDPRLRAQLATAGPWLAALIFVVMVTPLALEISDQGYLVLEHAANKSRGTPNPHVFLAAQFLMCSALLLILAVSARRPVPGRPLGTSTQADEALRFLLVFAFGPILFLVVQSLVMSTRLRDLWALPMGSLLGLTAVMLLECRGWTIDDLRLRRLVWSFVLAAPLLYGAAKEYGTNSGVPPSTSWPQREISERLEARWDEATGVPLKLVGGDAVEGGLVALTARYRPSLLIDLELRRAPWIKADRIARDGMLVVWPYTYVAGQEKHRALTAACVPRAESFPWAGRPDVKPLVLHYCIIPPRG
jgi:Dolichyl-phosphate-mannose-protein mannosyltransferase